MNASPDLSLSLDQENLLRTALASNPHSSPRSSAGVQQTLDQSSAEIMANGLATQVSPNQDAPGSGELGSFDDSPFLDYNEIDEGNYDWDESQDNLFGDLPETDSVDSDHHDKRKASVEDEGLDGTSNKRREGEERQAKKPGRKPLTAEPTTVSAFIYVCFN